MATTENYNLYIQGANEDPSFKDWAEQVAGENDSNMVKIAAALAALQAAIDAANALIAELQSGIEGITPASIGAAESGHTHTAAEVGAASSGHTHTAAEVGAAASGHTHSSLPSGTVVANSTTYSSAMLRNIKAQTTDPGAGSTLTSGTILIVYES